jgi:ATP-binding cassette, subfamily B, bacterial
MKNPYFSLLAKAWKYARQEKKRFALIYGLFVLANITIALNPLFYGWFINSLQLQGADILKQGWIYALGFLGLRLLEWAFHGPARVMERKLAFNLGRNFIDELYHKVLHLPVKWHQDNHSGSTISRLQKAHLGLRDFFQSGFVYFYSFGKFFFSFAAMLYFSPLFGAIGVLIGTLTIFIIIRFDKPYLQSLREANNREHEVSSTLFDSLSNIVTVITLRLEKSMQSSFMQKLAAVFPPFRRNVVINEWKWFTAQMMVGLIYVTITVGYLYQHWTPSEPFLIGGLVVLLGYVNQFTSVFNDIAAQYTQITRFHTEVQNVADIELAWDQKHTPEETVLPAVWNEIAIQQLNFSRDNDRSLGRPTGLDNVNLRITRGKRIALIGESGSGKSTLLATLRGLYTPIPGVQTVIDQTQHVPFNSLGGTITLFPQDPEIFENTIRYNITLGLPFSDDDVMAACEAAQFADVVRTLPHGLETNIQEKGVNLSGGQKQRLALARGILAARSSSIVLMDEPTSSVDPRTEKRIYNALFHTMQDKAVISSLHRLHLLTEFDYIYILRNGAVIEEGTFEELKRCSLVFNELWEHQAATTDVQAPFAGEISAVG